MRAITMREPGGPDVLEWTATPDPEPGPGEVLIEVVASAVNRADLLQRQGSYPPPPGASDVLGLECSGTIAALGDGVSGWAVGDPVCALLAGGGYAELAVAPAAQLLPVPSGVDLVTAASLPEVAGTVWSNVVMAAQLGVGEVLLVHGAAGGVGTHAIQVGKAIGAMVAVTAGSDERLARCAELGADVLVNYREQDFVAEVREATSGAGADVVLDNMGAAYLERNVDVLARHGRLIIIGMQGGIKATLNVGALLAKCASIAATGLRYRPVAEKGVIVAEVTQALWPLVEAGEVRPVVHDVLPIARAAEAHRLMEQAHPFGKVVLQVR
ncbi:MAG: NAD(P)H-quinone oxidoreductase [Labedaea sp.]